MSEKKDTRNRFFTHIVFLLAGWALVYHGHSCLVPNASSPLLIAILDPSVHGLIALLLILPFYLWKRIELKYLIIAVVLAVLIDLDHALAAQSFSLDKMLSLPQRPIGHSVLFCVLISVLAALVVKFGLNSKKSMRLLVYLFFIALFSHVARDAINSPNTPWAYPFDLPPFSETVFFVVFIYLNLTHLFYAYIRNTLPMASWEKVA